MIHFVIGRESGPPSFNPINSDSLINALHVEQLVGTLVRMAPSGRYEGFLADKWEISDDGHRWRFALRPGLFCEDGTPITAVSFKKSLGQMIRLVGSRTELPLIDRLNNFEAFRAGRSEEIGIEATDNDQILELHFSKPVLSGFLEYAALPIMGFYCDANFESDGSWKNDHQIISSSSFKLSPWDGQGPVTLLRRSDWPIPGGNIDGVIISRQKLDPKDLNNSRTISFSPLLTKEHLSSEAEVVRTLPTIFHSLIVSSERHTLLKNREFRAALRDAIYSARSETPIQIPGVDQVFRLYPHMSNTVEPVKPLVARGRFSSSEAFEILSVENPGAVGSEILRLTAKALEGLGIPYKIVYSSNQDKRLMDFWRNPKHWDLRVASVDIGGGIENQLIKFMFCSKLGVSFPDPSGRICALVEEFENRYGDNPSVDAMVEYIERFDRIVEEDAGVIPMAKSGGAWIISDDIDPKFVNPSMGVPYFDLVNMK